ncbi:MAG: uridine diphosphate-N-acetylglucosamine-binding protein YvcK [Acidobacteria bacterium]|nr:uridine diphosphate-N-acetylglucosamine-binding protein YvcK [Acidobacteriota bacterium]
MVNLVGIGGGTGLPVLLRGLRQFSEGLEPSAQNPVHISAIVCVSDNGGSSGSLRHHFGIPAVGDLRNCLVALSDGDSLLADLFQYRFSGGNGLNGHALGNLIVTAFCQMSGSLGGAVELSKEVLRSQGCVFPVTEIASSLCAEFESGDQIRGESEITAARGRIARVWLEPGNPPPSCGVLQTLDDADAIILGPGSLYTSIIPNLLVAGVAEAVRNSPALKIFVCNLVTQPGETDGFTAADHLRALETYLGAGVIDVCVLNSQPIARTVEEKYLETGSEPVRWSKDEIARMGVVPAIADLLEESQTKVRHDPIRLARSILSFTWVFSPRAKFFPGEKAGLPERGTLCAELLGI